MSNEYSHFEVWATFKILELREALGYNNSFFTTSELDILFKIRDDNKPKEYLDKNVK